MKLRERNVAHMWADKRVIRFFRHSFEKREYRKLRDVYIALCEIDSDFTEEKFSDEKSIRNLTKTCTTYTGMDQGGVSKILQLLKELNFIDYGHKRDSEGKVIGSYLVMFCWQGDEYYKSLIRVDPNMGRPGWYIKNNNLLEGYKNSSKEEGLSFSKEKDSPLPAGNGATSSDEPILRRRKIPLSEKPKRVPLGIQQILTVWNTSGLRKHENPETKIYRQCVDSIRKLMQGKFFYENTVSNGYQDRQFARDEIVQVIDNFKLAALNPDYEPSNSYKGHLKKMSFVDFLYNPYAQDGERSLFVKYFENPPRLCADNVRPANDEYPDITRELGKMYGARVKGNVGGQLTLKEQNKLVMGARKINDFYVSNKKGIDPLFVKTVRDRVGLVVDGLMDYYKDSIQAGNFCSDYTYDTIMPLYLQRQAVLR